MAKFKQLVNYMSSDRTFLSGRSITKEELDEKIEFVTFSPTPFNLQHTKYFAMTDEEMNKKLRNTANKHMNYYNFLRLSFF